ncbi:MAG: CvpA family protein [Bacteroidota bacterium]
MILDVIGVIILLFFFVRGYSKGLIVAAFSVVAILLGLLCALKLSQSFAAWLLEKGYVTSGWVQVVSYLVLFIGVVLLVKLVARIIEKAAEGLMLGFINGLAGGMLYAFLGAVLWSSLLWIAVHAHIVTDKTIGESKTYSFFAGIAPWFFEQAGKLLPFVKDTFAKLDHFFDTVNKK